MDECGNTVAPDSMLRVPEEGGASDVAMMIVWYVNER